MSAVAAATHVSRALLMAAGAGGGHGERLEALLAGIGSGELLDANFARRREV